jgi:hypothetical protein
MEGEGAQEPCMRHARILDVLSAVADVATGHSEIAAWWYAPPRRLRLQGEIAPAHRERPLLEVVVQAEEGLSTDCEAIAVELSRRLPGSSVSVRHHRGRDEERQLFRLVSGGPSRVAGERGTRASAAERAP